jgi:hypothetical protein
MARDYGHELQFGVFITPDAGQANAVVGHGTRNDALPLLRARRRTAWSQTSAAMRD